MRKNNIVKIIAMLLLVFVFACKEKWVNEPDSPQKLWTSVLKSATYEKANSFWSSDTWVCKFENKRTVVVFDQPKGGWLIGGEYELWDYPDKLRLKRKKDWRFRRYRDIPRVYQKRGEK